MRHWAYTLDAATSIVAAKAKSMEQHRMTTYLGAVLIGIVVFSAIIELFKREPKHEAQAHIVDLHSLPAGSIIVLPKGGA